MRLGKQLLPALVLASPLLASVLLAGCGRGEGGANTPTPTLPATASPGAPIPPPSAQPPPALKAERVVDLGTAQPLTAIIGIDKGDLESDIPGLASGDFNGDGLADILIGARFGDGPENGRENAGEAYVVLGSPEPLTSVDLAAGEQALTVYGPTRGAGLGFAAAAADVNGDGLDDIILGAPFVPRPADRAGRTGAVYILFGRDGLSGQVDLASQAADVTLWGDSTGAFFGDSLATGDINGDSLADILVGATFQRSSPPEGPSVSQTGAVYVFLGRREWPPTLDTRAREYDAAVFGAERFDEVGDNVACGDINGDGFADIIITAEAADGPDNTRQTAAEVYAVFGSATISGDRYIGRGDQDLTIYGAEAGDTLGFALAAGDLNGDGIDDLAMTARLADGPNNSLPSAGEAYVLLGSRDLPRAIDLAQGPDGLIALHSPSASDLMGSAAIADLTGDGRGELLLGIGFADGPGGARRDGGIVSALDVDDVQGFASLASMPLALVAFGAREGDGLGTSVAAGDVNGDGRLEIIAVAAGADGPGGDRPDVGIVYVIGAGD